MHKETLKIMHEFQLKTLTETVGMLIKLVAFYLAILAVCVGYVFSSNIDPDIKVSILISVLITSFFFLILTLSLSYGVVNK